MRAATPIRRLFAITPAVARAATSGRSLSTLEGVDVGRSSSTPNALSVASSSTDRSRGPVRAFSTSPSRFASGTKPSTPASSAEVFNDILASIFRSVEVDGSPLRPPPLPLGAKKPQIWGAPSKLEEEQRRLQAQQSEQEELDQAVVDAYNLLKAELGTLQSDSAVLAWAKSTIFRTTLDNAGNITYSKAYPDILAHTMRTLRHNYDNPHLALALFHHAKTLGPESYIAGCLVSAYNEVLTIRWESLRDFAGFELAIGEMDANAVFWNRQTSSLVAKVVETVGRDLSLGREVKWGSDAYKKLAGLERMLEESYEWQQKAEARVRAGLSGLHDHSGPYSSA